MTMYLSHIYDHVCHVVDHPHEGTELLRPGSSARPAQLADTLVHVPSRFLWQQILQAVDMNSLSLTSCPRAAITAARAAAGGAGGGTVPAPKDGVLRLKLGKQFPNCLLLHGSQLPGLYTSKHFVNLTNGLELAPLLQQLRLPFSVVRIRSTCLEQQLFEALMLELDANLLLALALGHSCILWDCGCRNMSNGAPRAVWYGIEFIRFALHRFWLGSGGPAHLRGYSVKADFEAACRKFHPSTKKRLRYYQRFLTPHVKQHGVQLAGVFSRTHRDEDVHFYVDKAWQHCGVRQPQPEQPAGHPGYAATQQEKAWQVCQEPALHPGPSQSNGVQLQPVLEPPDVTAAPAHAELQSWDSGIGCLGHGLGCPTASRLAAADFEAYELLVSKGMGMFTAGLSHAQFADLKSDGVL